MIMVTLHTSLYSNPSSVHGSHRLAVLRWRMEANGEEMAMIARSHPEIFGFEWLDPKLAPIGKPRSC